ncbi:MAG: hypothetical protein ABIO49_05730 [Dokdonella sp.]
MNRVSKKVVIAALIFGAAFVVQGSAQSGAGPYDIKSVVIAGGGSPIAGGSYQITSTLGQPATSTLSGASFVIVDGFWAPVGTLIGDSIFANGFESP